MIFTIKLGTGKTIELHENEWAELKRFFGHEAVKEVPAIIYERVPAAPIPYDPFGTGFPVNPFLYPTITCQAGG